MSLYCSKCGRDINAIGQDNVSYNDNPLCEDCGLTKRTDAFVEEPLKEFHEGELVLYAPKGMDGKPYKYEIGVVKRVCPDPTGDCFVWYHSGDTCARTQNRDLEKIDNDYQFGALLIRKNAWDAMLKAQKED